MNLLVRPSLGSFLLVINLGISYTNFQWTVIIQMFLGFFVIATISSFGVYSENNKDFCKYS